MAHIVMPCNFVVVLLFLGCSVAAIKMFRPNWLLFDKRRGVTDMLCHPQKNLHHAWRSSCNPPQLGQVDAIGLACKDLHARVHVPKGHHKSMTTQKNMGQHSSNTQRERRLSITSFSMYDLVFKYLFLCFIHLVLECFNTIRDDGIYQLPFRRVRRRYYKSS